MIRIEDELRSAAAELRAAMSDTDVDRSLDRVLAGRTAPRRSAMVAVAAAVVVLALVSAVVAWWPDRSADVIADGSDRHGATMADDRVHEVSGRVVSTADGSNLSSGSLSYAGTSDSMAAQLATVVAGGGSQGVSEGVAEVDFDRSIVLGITVSAEHACPSAPTSFLVNGDELGITLPDGEPAECPSEDVTRTFFVALARTDVPDRFTLVLYPPYSGSTEERTLFVDLTAASAEAPIEVPTSIAALPSDPPNPGEVRTITFDGIGDVRIGQVVPPEEVSTNGPGDECGVWPEGELTRSADSPPWAIVRAADTESPTVAAVYLHGNTSYRTASGVGVGTTLDTLQLVYGERLVIDVADGWESPTDGLLGSYLSVAAVREGDRAITYLLAHDSDPGDAVVEGVKVSAAQWWGDDEGCV